jgi:hypothetical protein
MEILILISPALLVSFLGFPMHKLVSIRIEQKFFSLFIERATVVVVDLNSLVQNYLSQFIFSLIYKSNSKVMLYRYVMKFRIGILMTLLSSQYVRNSFSHRKEDCRKQVLPKAISSKLTFSKCYIVEFQ